MIDTRYLSFVWKNHRGLVLFSLVIASAFQFLIIWLITGLDFGSMMNTIMAQLPARFRILFNQEFLSRFTVKGAMALGLNHPLVLSLLGITAIVIPTRHIAGEIESGTLELLLSYPVKRTRLLLNLWLSSNSTILLISGCAGIGSISAVAMFHHLSRELFLQIAQLTINLWLLFSTIATYTLLLSVYGKEGNRVGLRAAGVTLTFYFLHIVSTIWTALNFLRPFNIFTYYQPQKVMFGERSFLLNAAVLAGAIIVCLLFSLREFERRDIP